ncbi:MAG: hypothetical protein ACFB16_03305, partial [Phormidesmis sp.]
NREVTSSKEENQRHLPQTQPKKLKVISVVKPFSPPPTFIDYAGEGDEPADLALITLIPEGLESLNLPGAPPPAQPQAPACVINACKLTDRPLTVEATTAAELAELIPLNLSSLDQSFQQTPIQHLQEITIEQNKVAQSTTYQSAAHQSSEHQESRQQDSGQHSSGQESKAIPTHPPLPDLAKLPRADCHQPVEIVRLPTPYLDQLDRIVDGLMKQQTQQARQNEQLGALVKQLLSRVAQQQTELNRLGKGNYTNVQQMIQTCLTQ